MADVKKIKEQVKHDRIRHAIILGYSKAEQFGGRTNEQIIEALDIAGFKIVYKPLVKEWHTNG